jgi:hypothetical protein
MLESVSGRGPARSVDSYRPPVVGQNQDLVRLLSEWPLTSGGRFGCYLIADSSPYSDLARSVESGVFQQFFGNEPALLAAEYGPYEESSSFFLVVDRERCQAAGTLRVIENSDRGLKTLNDIARPPLSISLEKVIHHHQIEDLDKCWDVGTVAVLKEYRGRSSGHVVSSLLYGLLRAGACNAGMEHMIAVLDTHAYRQIVDLLGAPFVPIAGSEPFEYLGSQSSIAVYAPTQQMSRCIAARMQTLDSSILQHVRPLFERAAYESHLPAVVQVT